AGRCRTASSVLPGRAAGGPDLVAWGLPYCSPPGRLPLGPGQPQTRASATGRLAPQPLVLSLARHRPAVTALPAARGPTAAVDNAFSAPCRVIECLESAWSAAG